MANLFRCLLHRPLLRAFGKPLNLLPPRPLQVQPQQLLQYLLIRHLPLPSIRRAHRRIQLLVRTGPGSVPAPIASRPRRRVSICSQNLGVSGSWEIPLDGLLWLFTALSIQHPYLSRKCSLAVIRGVCKIATFYPVSLRNRRSDRREAG